MAYGRRKYAAVHYTPCLNCGGDVYHGDYCERCQAEMPERPCEACSRTSRTSGSACNYCDAPLGRLNFGRDRLAAGPQRIGGWTGTEPHPDAVWEVAPGVHYFRGEVDERPMPVVKGKAPGIGFPANGTDTGNRAYLASIRKGAGDPGTTWRKCYACGEELRTERLGKYGKYRQRIVASEEPGRYFYDQTQLAHPTCALTADEEAAMAASRERLAREAIEREQKRREVEASKPVANASWAGLHGLV